MGCPFNPYSRGYLPHDGRLHTLQTVTFRQADSIPGFLGRKFTRMLDCTPCTLEQRVKFELTYQQLCQETIDCCYGSCLLRSPEAAAVVLDKIFAEDGNYYDVLAWSIVPNHVHLLLYILKDMGHGIMLMKSRSAKVINEMFARNDSHFWAYGFFDRYIRSRQHFDSALEYLLDNPKKCGFTNQFTGMSMKINDVDLMLQQMYQG